MSDALIGFDDTDDIVQQYGESEKEKGRIRDNLDGARVRIAWYGYGDYDGSSLVVYTKAGKIYEVHGGHCSCHGLEGQWDPEETSVAALLMRLKGDEPRSEEYSTGETEANAALQRLVIDLRRDGFR